MYQVEFDEFKKTLSDLCTSVNRPFNDDLCRVFWEDLKGFPLKQIQFRAKLLRATGKMKFTAGDLKPEPEEKPIDSGPSGPAAHEILAEYVIKNYPLTAAQIRTPWQYFGDQFNAPGLDGKMRTNHGVNITGVIVPPDGDKQGYRVTLRDMQLGEVA
jgi:hypothetical protein